MAAGEETTLDLRIRVILSVVLLVVSLEIVGSVAFTVQFVSGQLAELRASIPPPLFKAQVDDHENRLRMLEERAVQRDAMLKQRNLLQQEEAYRKSTDR